MGESYSGIRVLEDFIRDVIKYQHLVLKDLGIFYFAGLISSS